MSSTSIQLKKEARQMAWPWTIVMLPGLLVLAAPLLGSSPLFNTYAWQKFVDWVVPVGAFFGTSLLATLPLGTEFQYNTLATRFAQPIDRSALWREKFLVSIVAVAPVAVVYCTAIHLRFERDFSLMAIAWIVVAVAGAIPFTLIARSTIGGMVMSTFATCVVTFTYSYYEKHGEVPPTILWMTTIILSAYVVIILWLGRRMMLGYQATDGMQAGESFVPGARLVPRAVSEWFRCRPRQPIANLIRREFRLLRVLWPMSLLYAVAWVFLVLFHQLPNDHPDSLHIFTFGMTVILGVIIAVLAGTLSLGEEKTWGTHQWHMTLPVSVSTQWIVKLGVALFTSVTVAGVLPISLLTAAGWIASKDLLHESLPAIWIAEVAGITLVAFWCACVVRGTVQATLWVFPLCFGIFFGFQGADVVLSFFRQSVSQLLTEFVAGRDPVVLARLSNEFFSDLYLSGMATLVAAPLVGIALIQTHRYFRAQLSANRLRLVRVAIPLVLTAFLWGAIGDLTFMLGGVTWRTESTTLRETDKALSKVAAIDAVGGVPRARQVSLTDLSSASPLSGTTQRWLANAQITVAAAPEHIGTGSGPYYPGRMAFYIPPK